MRLFPILLGIGAYVFLRLITNYRSGFPILSSMGSLTLLMLLFLAAITAFYEINKHSGWYKQKWFVAICINPFIKLGGLLKKNFGKIFSKLKTNKTETTPQETEKVDITQYDPSQDDLVQDDLVEIKKENVAVPVQTGMSLEKRIYAGLYITTFLGIVTWHISKIFKVMPLAFAGQYKGSIVDAVLMLLFPCVAVFYLKTRKDTSCPTDKISRDLLTLFSYTSFGYAAVIAVAAALKLNILVVLQWAYYAASAYLIIAVAVNILLSMLKGDILGFDYTLIPKISQTKNEDGLQTADWKVSLKSLYTIRYTLSILPGLVLALIFILFVSTSIFVVQPHQQAAVYHFGKLKPSSIKSEGFHFKFPWPIDKAEIYDVHRAAGMQIGYEASGTANFLWTQKHDGGEFMLLLGNGNEIVAVNLKIMYVISDLYSYIKTCANPEVILSAAAYNALMARTITTTLDSFLSVDRNSLSVSVLNELAAFCETEKLGFSVVQVIIESIHPPVDIADVYQKVVSASVDKTTVITRAEIFAQTKIAEAQRQSKSAIDSARAMQFSRVSDAQKEAAIITGAIGAYNISPGSFELTRSLDVYEKIISGNKVYVFTRGAESSIPKFVIGNSSMLNLLGANKGESNE